MKKLLFTALIFTALTGCEKEKLEQPDLCKLQHTGTIGINNQSNALITISLDGLALWHCNPQSLGSIQGLNAPQTYVFTATNGVGGSFTTNITTAECDVVWVTLY